MFYNKIKTQVIYQIKAIISTKSLSVFIFHNNQNGICNKNPSSIKEIMCMSYLAFDKYKKVCDNLPNPSILSNSATPGEVQLTFVHAYVGNTSLMEYVVAFALEGSLNSPSVVSININISFTMYGDKICLPIPELLHHTDAGNVVRSNNWHY